MRIRDWQDVLRDVSEAAGDAADWRAVAGRRRTGVGEDLFLGHPRVGVFQVKTYAKSPLEVRGVGARVARKVDDGLDPYFPDRAGANRFAVRDAPDDEDQVKTRLTRLEETLEVHAEAPTTPEDLFEDVMEAIESPAHGPMECERSDRPDGLDDLTDTFEEAEELLSAELDDLIEDDEVDKGFY